LALAAIAASPPVSGDVDGVDVVAAASGGEAMENGPGGP